MQEKIFRHEITFTDNTETMAAEGYLETRTETGFVRVVNKDLYPVLTVRRDRIDYIESTPVEEETVELQEGNTVQVEFSGTVTEVNGDWVNVLRDDMGSTLLPSGASNAVRLIVHKRFIKKQ